jgi:PhoH-like ATPase
VVDEIQRDAGHEPVYDLEVEGNHNFVACSGSKGVRNTGSTGILAHNCQNATPHEVKTVVSRAANGTKVVLCGDPSQIDDPFLDAFSNGLVHAAKATRDSPLAGAVYLGEGVRSPLADLAAKAL